MDVELYQPQGMDQYLKEMQEKEKNMMQLFTTVQQKTEESHQLQLTCQHQAAQLALMQVKGKELIDKAKEGERVAKEERDAFEKGALTLRELGM